jgi:hypothetical protein
MLPRSNSLKINVMRDLKSAQKLKIAFSTCTKYSDSNDGKDQVLSATSVKTTRTQPSVKKSYNAVSNEQLRSQRSSYLSTYASQKYLDILESQKIQDLDAAVEKDLQTRRRMDAFGNGAKSATVTATHHRQSGDKKANDTNSDQENNLSSYPAASRTYMSNQLSSDSQSSMENISSIGQQPGMQ